MERERRTPMRPVKVERLCATNDCPGMMVHDGESIMTRFKTRTRHRCDTCARFEWIDNRRYPAIEYEPVTVEQSATVEQIRKMMLDEMARGRR